MPTISIFSNVETAKEPRHIDFDEYLEQTRDGEWEDIVTAYRLILMKDLDAAEKFKKTMPTTTLSGKYDYRSDAGLVDHSGFLNIDLDDVNNLNSLKADLCKDKYV